MSLTSGGSNCIWKAVQLQSTGAATAKLRSPSVRRVFILGCCNRISLMILSYNYVCFYAVALQAKIKFARHNGAQALEGCFAERLL